MKIYGWKLKLLFLQKRFVWRHGAESVPAPESAEPGKETVSKTDRSQRAERRESIILRRIEEFYKLGPGGVPDSPDAMKIKQETMGRVFEYCREHAPGLAREIFDPIFEKFWKRVDIKPDSGDTDRQKRQEGDKPPIPATGDTPTGITSD